MILDKTRKHVTFIPRKEYFYYRIKTLSYFVLRMTLTCSWREGGIINSEGWAASVLLNIISTVVTCRGEQTGGRVDLSSAFGAVHTSTSVDRGQCVVLSTKTICTQQSPSWKADMRSACQTFPVFYEAQMFTATGPYLSQMNPVHTFTLLFQNRPVTTLKSALISCSWFTTLSFSYRFLSSHEERQPKQAGQDVGCQGCRVATSTGTTSCSW
jgi:hypothetical protein